MKQLPQSQEAEKGLLSSFLIKPSEVGALCAAKHIGPQHFLTPGHAIIYGVLVEKWQKGEDCDFILLTQILRDSGQLEDAGGAFYVTGLFTFLPTAAKAGEYADILKEKHVLREIILMCQDANERSYQEPASDIVSSLSRRIAEIGTSDTHSIPTMSQNVADATGALERRISNDPSVVLTGLKAIDEDAGPLERGHLLVIAGQRKAGKSILATQISLNIGLSNRPVLFISLEMNEREITFRKLASMARVEPRKVGIWNEFEYRRYGAASQTLSKAPIHIVTRRYELADLIGVCRQFHAQYSHASEPLACIVLDYAQLVRSGAAADRRQQEVAAVSRTAKQLASELNVLFVLLVQLNDDGRCREARDPEMDANMMLEVGHNEETGSRGVKVVCARSAPGGERLKLAIIPHHTRVEDCTVEEETEQQPPPKRNGSKKPVRSWSD